MYAADLGFDATLSRPCQHPGNVWSLHGYHECLQRLGRADEATIIGRQLELAQARADVPIRASCACRLDPHSVRHASAETAESESRAHTLPIVRFEWILTVVAVALLFGAGTAHAAPVWSGLDVRDYAGPIPPSGTLIAPTPLDPAVSLPNAGRALRIHYSTPDVHGNPATSTGAVFLPDSPPPPGGYPVIAWAHGTTGIGDDCAPSTMPNSPRNTIYLSHWLDQGYAIVATDYQGLGTPGLMSYLNGQVEATSVVDSVRAAHQLGLPLANRWAIVGQSQGAGAALNAAQRATALSAGTDLDYRGVVATGIPANFETVFALAGPDLPPVALPAPLNTYAAYLWAGFADARPDLDPASILSPLGHRLFDLAHTLCYADMTKEVAGLQLRDFLAEPVASIPGCSRRWPTTCARRMPAMTARSSSARACVTSTCRHRRRCHCTYRWLRTTSPSNCTSTRTRTIPAHSSRRCPIRRRSWRGSWRDRHTMRTGHPNPSATSTTTPESPG